MQVKKRRNGILSIIVLVVIFAFVATVLVYVGGALLQTVNFSRPSEPGTSLIGGIAGAVLGIIFGLIQRHNSHREL